MLQQAPERHAKPGTCRLYRIHGWPRALEGLDIGHQDTSTAAAARHALLFDTWLTFSIRSANWYFPMDMTCAPATVQRMHAVREHMMMPDLPLSSQLHCCGNLNLPLDKTTHTSIQTEQRPLQRLSFSSRIFMPSTPPCPTTTCPPQLTQDTTPSSPIDTIGCRILVDLPPSCKPPRFSK